MVISRNEIKGKNEFSTGGLLSIPQFISNFGLDNRKMLFSFLKENFQSR